MKCSLTDCPGVYEERRVIHTVRHLGQVVVIDHVPAEVCPVCGDVLFTSQTVSKLENLLRQMGTPSKSVPLYEYA
ncbi:MAG: YgiT-type zinc finger protein [Armatimonadetes bacterium]|nr:YgiT-type zinc finger protein [Armatimonadota bacterium]